MLKETQHDEYPLYAKIGCQHRDTYTSTKLQLIVYKDAQCSREYIEDEMKGDGYDLNGYYLSTKVSFRPPFYSCQGCSPEEVSGSFTKQYTAWYDDDYISGQGQKRQYDDDAAEDEQEEAEDDGAGGGGGADDDGSYYQQNDDNYNYAVDDAAAADDAYYADDYANNHYVNRDDAVKYNYKKHDDDFYALDDDDGGRRLETTDADADAGRSLTAKEARKVRLAGRQAEGIHFSQKYRPLSLCGSNYPAAG